MSNLSTCTLYKGLEKTECSLLAHILCNLVFPGPVIMCKCDWDYCSNYKDQKTNTNHFYGKNKITLMIRHWKNSSVQHAGIDEIVRVLVLPVHNLTTNAKDSNNSYLGRKTNLCLLHILIKSVEVVT